mmetsp:Transcript_6402/g.15946  ORF Transcript_6402/g.15946 Transcript_6402/m.15946 type:complete len:211 (+) Transcript_6402:176-808(+)
MRADGIAERRRWLAQALDHRVPQRVLLDRRVVLAAGLVAVRGAHHTLVPRLVKVRLGAEDERLHGDDHLQHGGRCRVPGLSLGAAPGTQKAEAHLTVLVQVGVEAHAAAARGSELELRRRGGVGAGEESVEDEAAAVVWGILRTGEHDRPQHGALLIDAHQRRGGAVQGKRGAQARHLAGDARDVRAPAEVVARVVDVRVARAQGCGVEH